MYMSVRKYHDEIRNYCQAHNLSFEKTIASVKGCNDDSVFFQALVKSEKSRTGLRNETPLPVVLIMKKVGTRVVFEQTEHTKHFLSV